MAIPNDKGGYEYHFVDPPSDTLVCKICQYPSREPHLSGCCGHTFCKSCLEGAKKVTTIADACPICRNKQFVTMPNKQANRTIRSLHVFCANKKKGCEWQGEVNNIVDHLTKSTGCQLEEVICSNNCGQTLQRQLLTSHVEAKCPRRKVDCQYCHITGECQFVKGEHKEQCPKFPIACPNKCEVGSVPRDDVEEHMKMCPLELVQCEYHVVGCEERMARKDQKKHNKEKMEEHLSFTTHQLTNIQHNLANSQVEAVDSKDKLTTKITQTGKDLATTKQHLSSAVKTIDQLIQRLQQTERDTVSQLEKYKDEFSMRIEQERNESKEQLAVTKDDLTLKLQRTENELTITKQELTVTKIEVRSTKVSFADALKELADTKADLKSTQEEARKTKDDLTQQLAVTKQEAKKTKDELTQKLTNTQRDLNTTKQQVATTCQNLTKAEKEHITLAANTDEVLAKLETKFQTKITEIETVAQKRITELETNLMQKTQQIDKLLLTTWGMDIVLMASKLSSGDQVVPVIVKMSEYTKKSDGVSLYSDSFYTHHKGYKMCLYVYARGHTTGYMKVCLYLMKGPYDDQLRWPVKVHCEVKLLNQISNSEHHLGNGEYWGNGHKRVTSGIVVTSGERCSYAMWFSDKFISHQHLQKITPTCQYLKDDSIFLQVDYKLGTV